MQKGKLCKCGCGQLIVIKPWHKWAGIPDYLHGHNRRGCVTSDETKKLLSIKKIGDKNPSKRNDVKKKMRKAALIKWQKPGYKKAHSGNNAPMSNKTHSDKTKTKMSKARSGEKNGFYGRKCAKEHKLKISIANKGRKQSHEERIKRSIAQRKSTKTTWNGGTSFDPYSIDFTMILREQIRERDKHTCQLCGKSDISLAVHHIDYDRKNADPGNLISLCISCHAKTNVKRSKWRKFFMEMMEERQVINA